MTPEEKAFEILEKYLIIFEILGVRTVWNKTNYDKAKQCALICVDEIIKSFKNLKDLNDGDKLPCVIYWEWVKESINNL